MLAREIGALAAGSAVWWARLGGTIGVGEADGPRPGAKWAGVWREDPKGQGQDWPSQS